MGHAHLVEWVDDDGGITDDLREGSTRRGDDRETHGHGLYHGQPEPLVKGGVDQHVCGTVLAFQFIIVHVAHDRDRGSPPEPLADGLGLVAVGPDYTKGDGPRGRHDPDGRQKAQQVLPGLERAEREDTHGTVSDLLDLFRGPSQEPGIHAIVDGHHASVIEVVPLDEVTSGCLGHRHHRPGPSSAVADQQAVTKEFRAPEELGMQLVRDIVDRDNDRAP
jgi:hypothetical protein